MNALFGSKARTAIASSYTMYASADIVRNGEIIKEGILLDETDAAVSVDGTANVRRTFAMTIPDPLSYLPLTPTSVLSPFIMELVVYAGVRYGDGSVDRWPIFTGAIEDPNVTDDGGLTMKLTASDRAQNISERRLPTIYTIAGGTDVTQAIQDLINLVRPGLQFVIVTPVITPTLPAAPTVFAELADPFQSCVDMATAHGMEVFFNGAGQCVIQPVLDPRFSEPVWNFAEGTGSMLKTVNQTLTAKASYSHAIVKSQPLDGSAPLRSDEYDLVETSPTFFDPTRPWLSSFGDKPVELVSDLIHTQDQADNASQALLNRKKGAIQNVQFSHAPVTALDEHDVITITRSRLGMAALPLTLEKFSIPCTPAGEMAPTCRSQTV